MRHSDGPDTTPWGNVEIKFRDGMKSLYSNDYKRKKMTGQLKPQHKSGDTARFTSPMFLKTEYNDYYKPYRVKQVSHVSQKERDKPLVQLPHVDRSHY